MSLFELGDHLLADIGTLAHGERLARETLAVASGLDLRVRGLTHGANDVVLLARHGRESCQLGVRGERADDHPLVPQHDLRCDDQDTQDFES